MDTAIAQFGAWAQGILGQYGLAGVLIAFQALCNIKQYFDNQGLHSELRLAERGFRGEISDLQDQRLADYQAIAPMLAENVASNAAVTKAMQDGQRVIETVMLRESGRRRT